MRWCRSGQYSEVYFNLYYLLAQSEDTSAIDKWAGFIFTKEGEEFVEQNASLCKYDLLYNPLRFESWQRLANIYDEEVDLLLNDGSKHINVTGWWNNATLPHRVVTSRRRSKRCLLMSLALAETPSQQSEIHELLALVYYDNLQNVVPQSDQRSTILSKDASWNLLCRNSMKHFKAAYENMKDWSHALYLGKLFEKSEPANKLAFAYFDEAISLNPSSVDAIYRMHASRIKLLVTCGMHDVESLKIVNAYSFSLEKKELIASALEGACLICSETDPDAHAHQMDMARRILFDDCFAALQTCVEGDLKHFHKARYAIAKALYMRRQSGDLERARDELSFCFRSSRSSFAFNMWEIDDGLTKKVRRRTPGIAVQKKALEVNLPESSRKFISCMRKYILLYLKLLEETSDTHTLDRAYTSIRNDKRFSVCLEDLVPVAVGIYMKALVSAADEASEHVWEKVLSLFMEHWSSWPEICVIPECAHLQLSESRVYRCVNGYMEWLEKNGRLETMEVAVDKMRKRLRNLKISGEVACNKLITDSCNALGRLIVLRLASVTPAEAVSEDERGGPLVVVDLLADELRNWGISDDDHERRSMVMMMGGGVVVRQWIDKGVDTQLLRYCYNFCREGGACTHSSLPTSALRLRIMSSPSGALHTLSLTLPLKLLLWAYALVHGHYAPPPAVLKYFEENVKLKLKKAASDTGRREAETLLHSQTERSTPTPEAPENHSHHFSI